MAELLSSSFSGLCVSEKMSTETDSGFVDTVEAIDDTDSTSEDQTPSLAVTERSEEFEEPSSEIVVPKQMPQVTPRVDQQTFPASLYNQQLQEQVPLMFERDADGENDLMIAVSHSDEPNHVQLACLIIDNAPDAELLNLRNKFGMTALAIATLYNNVFAIRRLRLAGADPNLCDYLGNSPVYYAAFYGNRKALLALTTTITEEEVRAYRSAFKRPVKSLDVNIRNCDGKAALYAAAERNHVEIVQALRNMSADPNIAENSAGRTALHAAVELGHYECVAALLKFPTVDVNSYTFAGRTPLDCTRYLSESSRISIVKLLSKYDAENGQDSELEDCD